MKKSVLNNYVKVLLKSCDEENCGTVTFDDWIAWITHEKHKHDRMLWLKKPWRSFIVIVSLTQIKLKSS